MFSVPCTVNGMAPAADGLAEPVDARIARQDRSAGAGTRRCRRASSARRGDDRPGRRCGGTKTRIGHRRGGRQRGRGVRRVAARGDGQRRSIRRRRPRREPSDSAVKRWSRIVTQMPRLVAAGDLPGLVLHPHAAIGGEAERVAERVGSPERRGVKTRAGHRSDRRRPSARPARRAPRSVIPFAAAKLSHAR